MNILKYTEFQMNNKTATYEFQSSRRVLESGSIVSGISFCNSLLLVVKSNKFPKIAVKFAQLDSLPNPFFAYENFSICISKFLHGPMSSKPKSTVGKYSNRCSQQQQQQQQQQQKLRKIRGCTHYYSTTTIS